MEDGPQQPAMFDAKVRSCALNVPPFSNGFCAAGGEVNSFSALKFSGSCASFWGRGDETSQLPVRT